MAGPETLRLLVRTGAMFLAGNQPHQTALPQFEEVISPANPPASIARHPQE